MSSLQDHNLFVQFSSRDPGHQEAFSRLRPPINKYLTEWRGQSIHADLNVHEKVLCLGCVEAEEAEPVVFKRKHLVKSMRLWQNKVSQEKFDGLQESPINSRFIKCEKGHTVDPHELLSRSILTEMVPCPQCITHGTIPPQAFDRMECVSLFSEDSNARFGSKDCRKCALAGLPSAIRVLDIVKPECFISYQWGKVVHPETKEPYNASQESVLRLRSRVELLTSVVCWVDVSGGMGAGQDLKKEMKEGVQRCKVFLLFLSDAYLTSDNCLRELYCALTEWKFIIPIFLPDNGPTVRYNKGNNGYVSDGPASGWPASAPGADDPDWWKYCVEKSGRKAFDPDDPKKERAIRFDSLAGLRPVDLRPKGMLDPGSSAEKEIERRIMARFHRPQKREIHDADTI